MRRSFEELAPLFDELDTDYSLESDNQEEFAFMALMHLKMVIAISSKLYGEKKFCPDIMIDEYSDVIYEGYPVEDDLEFIMESKLSSGCLADYVLAYFLKSPHWDVRIANLYVECGDERLDVEEEAGDYVAEHFVRCVYDSFFEEEVYEDKKKLDSICFYYNVGADFTDDLCIIKSSLYPYVEKITTLAKGKYPEETRYLQRAFRVIETWLTGYDSDFQTEKFGYFFSSDNSDESYGYSYGCLLHNRAVVVAAELVEEIMFALDKEYHILPPQILREEELRWTQGQGGNLSP